MLLRSVRTKLFCREGFYLDVIPETGKLIGVARKDHQRMLLNEDLEDEDDIIKEEDEDMLEAEISITKPPQATTADNSQTKFSGKGGAVSINTGLNKKETTAPNPTKPHEQNMTGIRDKNQTNKENSLIKSTSHNILSQSVQDSATAHLDHTDREKNIGPSNKNIEMSQHEKNSEQFEKDYPTLKLCEVKTKNQPGTRVQGKIVRENDNITSGEKISGDPEMGSNSKSTSKSKSLASISRKKSSSKSQNLEDKIYTAGEEFSENVANNVKSARVLGTISSTHMSKSNSQTLEHSESKKSHKKSLMAHGASFKNKNTTGVSPHPGQAYSGTLGLGGSIAGMSTAKDRFSENNRNSGTDPTRGFSTQSCCFYLIPVGLRVVALQHCDSGLYVAMDPKGKLYTCEMFTVECKFKEQCAENYYVVYSSIQYRHPQKNRAMHIGINEKGKITRGTRAHKQRQCTHFLPHPIEVVMMREPNSYEVVGGPVGKTKPGHEVSASSSANIIGRKERMANPNFGANPIPEVVTH